MEWDVWTIMSDDINNINVTALSCNCQLKGGVRTPVLYQLIQGNYSYFALYYNTAGLF